MCGHNNMMDKIDKEMKREEDKLVVTYTGDAEKLDKIEAMYKMKMEHGGYKCEGGECKHEDGSKCEDCDGEKGEKMEGCCGGGCC